MVNFFWNIMVKKRHSLIFLLVIFFTQISIASDDDVVKIDLHIKDHKFTPEVVELPADKKVNITVYNDDPTIEEFESLDLKREKIVLGNSSIKIVLAPLAPGEYKFFGDFHQESAQGKIIVIGKNEDA
ncbi:MAG: cupredoxin domain-containing protein [Alphaproteobacteria bacterium]|jgi:plastocyanin|nr:cupredoxin domain-containing protein [Alphaproteobacteria bacterium]